MTVHADAASAGATPEGNPPTIAEHVGLVTDRLAEELAALAEGWDATLPDDSWAAAMDLPGRLSSLVLGGGKRTRPVMILLGWVAGHGVDGYDDVVRASVALELLHAFAVIHDDVMDESPTRRGLASVHAEAARLHAAHDGRGDSARFGDSVAVLVGDLAHSEAERLAAGLPAPLRAIWQQMVIELLAGQVTDIVGTAAGQRHLGFARRVARRKTGLYTIARPLQLGAAAAGAAPAALDALAEFGRQVGDAFALRDDLLGVYGDPGTTGKPIGDDIRSGKPTVLLALATERLEGDDAALLARAGCADMTDAEVDAVAEALRRTGVVATVEAMIDTRTRDALAALDPALLSGAGITQLRRLATELAGRRS
ncbi:polyprenyl synthetase family protein [Jatrophihabitans fulvus]